MKIGDLFYETWHALSANKGRSFLTILGIVIGIAAVIAMTSLIGGVRNGLISGMGLNAARIVHIHDHRLGAFGRKTADTGLANALGTAGDDTDAITKAEVDVRCGGGLCGKCHGR